MNATFRDIMIFLVFLHLMFPMTFGVMVIMSLLVMVNRLMLSVASLRGLTVV